MEATAKRTVTARVLDDEGFRHDQEGELRRQLILVIEAETKRGPVSNLYASTDCGGYVRLKKLGAKPAVHELTIDGGRAVSCNCEDATYHPERLCKHAESWNEILEQSHE